MVQVYGLILHPTEQLVLQALAEHAWDDGTKCYPSVGRIAWKTGCDRRTVMRTIRKLEEQGIMECVGNEKGGRGNTREYHLHLERGASKPPFVNKGGQSVPERGAMRPIKGGSLPPEPVREPVREPVNTTGESAGLITVKLSELEIETLGKELGEFLRNEYVNRLTDYMAATGKKYKSHFATIRTWHRKDRDRGMIPKPVPSQKSQGETRHGDSFYIPKPKTQQ